MRMYKSLTAALGLLALAGSEAALAGAWTVGSGSGNAGTQVTVPVNFAGDGVTISSQISVSVVAPLSVVSATGQNGQTCSAAGNTVTVVLFSFSALPGAATNYCNITLAIAPGTPASPPTLPVTGSGQLCAISGGGAAPTCTVANGAITVTGGVVNTPPMIAYNPTTGSTITYTGAGTGGPIVATPSGGAGSGAAATTTVGACTISGGGAAFPTTNIAQLSFVGNTTTAQNIALPNCVPQAGGPTNATLTCPETAGAGAAVNRVWPLVCPQAAPAGTPPTITYNPAAGSTSNVAAGANLLINVGCPTDGSPCNGSGTGNAATARLQSVAAVYTGLASPAPSMACTFVSEGGAAIGSPLDFVALAADPGDARCTCPMNTTGLPTETFRIDITEISPIGGASNVRQFNVVCGAPPPACGTLAANPASGTINLVNGGAGSTVSTFTLTGAGAGVTNTITCAASGVSAGTTFTVTTNPSPLTLANNASGTVTASCTNSEQTTGTGTLTCTATSTGQSCMPPSFTYTLSCPGQSAPPPGESVPVPAMSEQGRILLAALVLLLGLGVVGFRMRG